MHQRVLHVVLDFYTVVLVLIHVKRKIKDFMEVIMYVMNVIALVYNVLEQGLALVPNVPQELIYITINVLLVVKLGIGKMIMVKVEDLNVQLALQHLVVIVLSVKLVDLLAPFVQTHNIYKMEFV